jgi:hypothetical protein
MLPGAVKAEDRRWIWAVLCILAISVLLIFPSCKHKEAAPSNENSGAPSANTNPPQTPQPAPPQPLIVSAGATLTVRLTDQLGSAESQTGQAFTATLDKDVIVDGQTAIPAGANVSGTVVRARPAGKVAGEANLVLRLTSINVNNTDQPIVTAARAFGAKIKKKGKVKKFLGGLAKRAAGDEKEVVLPAQSAYTFTLKEALEILPSS